jgi:predicted AlkP superfamily pyrophosphatase or phosphodiesterase
VAARRGPLGVLVLLLAAGAGAAPRVDQRTGTSGINRPDQRAKPHVVLVSLDGFKPDYIDRFELPNVRRVASRGVRARAMTPVFPSLTFPNHYSLVTGLRPARHGIVSNTFYDRTRGQTYALSNQVAVRDGSWYRGEPIWVTAETQGMVAACFFWPGSEAAIGGVRPTFWNPYDTKVPNDERVNTVLGWLRLPEERRPHLITLYFSELDSTSHEGPLDGPDVERAARSVDRSVGVLLDGIDGLPIRDRIYLLLTSDHGMVETTPAQGIRLDALIDTSPIEHGIGGPVASLHVRGGRSGAIQVRNALNARLPHGRAYLREETPERLYYRSDPRAGDVVVIMDESWTLVTTPPPAAGRRVRERWGMHGWDPALASMKATFVAMGPGIRAATTVGEVENIDVYPFMAEVLGLRPAPGIDGRAGRLRRAFGDSPLFDPRSRGQSPFVLLPNVAVPAMIHP